MEFENSERFEIRDRLGKGGMGTVFRVVDRERGAEVALKALTGVGAGDIARLKNEFRSLADIVHPNLATLYELLQENGRWFFTMELVEGTDFFKWVRPQGVAKDQATMDLEDLDAWASELPEEEQQTPPPSQAQETVRFREDRLRAALPQLVAGVQAIHAAGKQHRDLKPENVLVTFDGRVVLLDFGLVTVEEGDLGYYDPVLLQSAGTPAYMAPEQHLRGQTTQASDWYSLGVMLYQALTGSLPYRAYSIFAREYVPPTPPREMDPSVPEDLEALALDLLRWAPEERPTGAEILRRLGAEEAVDAGPARGVFVGREAELGALHSALRELREGWPIRFWVEGRSGLGKSALVRTFLDEVREAPDVVVLSGRCHERETVPYKVFDQVVDGLVAWLGRQPPELVRSVLPADSFLLCRLFSSFERLVEAPEEEEISLEPSVLARRAALALKELLSRVGALQTLVITVDDLQWGDLDSARLLAELFRDPGPVRAMLICSYRHEDVLAKNPVLRALLDAGSQGSGTVRDHKLELQPLGPREARDLAVSILAPGGAGAPSDVAQLEQLVSEAGGSPFFVEEMARFLRGSSVKAGLHLKDALRARIGALSEQARELLEAVCVVGRPIPLALALEVASLSGEADKALLTLRQARMVRTAGLKLDDRVEPWHDRVREAVVAGLPADRQRQLHLRAATTLERTFPGEIDALATHWDQSGQTDRALPYLQQAAEQATRALAFDRAASLWERLLEIQPGRLDVEEALAEALRNAGRGRPAAQHYVALAERTAEGQVRMELRRKAFEQLLVSGHVDEGRELAKAVLADVGTSLPEGLVRKIISLLGGRARLWFRGIEFQPSTQIDAAARNRIDTHWSMATGLSIVDSVMGADFTTRGLLLALEAGDSAAVSRFLSFTAGHLSTAGAMDRAEAYIARGRELAQSAGPHEQGFAALMTGFIRYFQGRYAEAVAAFDEATPIFRDRCVGVNWELTTSTVFANWALVYTGDWLELKKRGPSLIQDATTRGNLYHAHGARVSSAIVSALADDDPALARKELQIATDSWSNEGFQVQHFLYLYMGTWIDLYEGRGPEAYARIMERWPALTRSLLLEVNDIRHRMWLARGYSAIAAGELGDARKAARKVASIPSRAAPPGATAIRAGVALKSGDREEGLRLLAEAASGFEAAGVTLYAAALRREIGRIEGRQDAVEAAERLIRERGVANPAAVSRIFVPV